MDDDTASAIVNASIHSADSDNNDIAEKKEEIVEQTKEELANGDSTSQILVKDEDGDVKEPSYMKKVLKAAIQPAMMLLFLAAAVRHTGKIIRLSRALFMY